MAIFGMGCHADGLTGYLDRFVAYCDRLRPAYVIFLGGPTQQHSAPGMTEAQMMHDYIVPRCPGLDSTVWLCDHESFTSVENVLNLKTLLDSETKATVLLTYTDAGRTLKVRFGTWWHMRDRRIIQETYDLQSNPAAQVVSLAMEAPMFMMPLLHTPWSLYRRGFRAKRL